MHRRAITDALIQRVLGDDRLSLSVDHVQVDEYPAPSHGCGLSLTLTTSSDAVPLRLEGRGVGFVDAAYRSLMDHFAATYESLGGLTFTGFRVRAHMETSHTAANLDAEVEVTLMVRNRNGRDFWFVASDRSTLSAAVAAVIEVVEHFVNAERAYQALHVALADAIERERGDLVDRYRAEMAQLVEVSRFESAAARFLRLTRLSR